MTHDGPLIAHVIDSLDISGGAEKQLIANLQSFDLRSLQHEVVLLRSTSVSRLADVPEDVAVHTLFERREKPTRISVIRRLTQLARFRKFDLMHGSLPMAALGVRAVGLSTKTRVVESLVNISHEPIRCIDNPSVTPAKLAMHTLLDRITMTVLFRLHAVSETVANSWVDTVGIDPSKITVIPRGVDHDALNTIAISSRRHTVRKELGVDRDDLLILSVGRLEPQKGHRYLLEAVSRAGIKELKLIIAGRHGTSTSALKALIEAHALDDRVRLIGPRTDVPDLLHAADVFAFPSLFEGNGGNAMIEAMAAGLAVVTTNEPPMTDLIPSDEFGLLVPRADSRGLAQAIRELAENEELRVRLGHAARQRALQFPSRADVSALFESWYHKILAT